MCRCGIKVLLKLAEQTPQDQCCIKEQEFFIIAQGYLHLLYMLSTGKAPVEILYFTCIFISFSRRNTAYSSHFSEVINICPPLDLCILLSRGPSGAPWWLPTPKFSMHLVSLPKYWAELAWLVWFTVLWDIGLTKCTFLFLSWFNV